MTKAQRFGLTLVIAGSIGAASAVPATLIVFFLFCLALGAFLFIAD